MEEMKRLYGQWLAMWNGDIGLANEIVSADFIIHQVRPGGVPSEVQRGPRAIREMVEESRAHFDEIQFCLEVGPITQGHMMSARWHCMASYRGGNPDATAPNGSRVSFSGIDILRVAEGKIREYWVSSDGLALMAQLGVLAA